MPHLPVRPTRYLIRLDGVRSLASPSIDLTTIAAEVQSLMGNSIQLAAVGTSPDGGVPTVVQLQNEALGLHALSVLLDADSRAKLQARHGEALRIELDHELHLQRSPGLERQGPVVAPTNYFATAGGLRLRFRIRGRGGAPLAAAAVEVVSSATFSSHRGRTDDAGLVELLVPDGTLETLDRLVVRAVSDHWGIDVDRPALLPASAGENVVQLDPLLAETKQDTTWGLRIMGLDRAPAIASPRRVRVAVVDSGVSASHPDLAPTGGMDFNPSDDPTRTWSSDASGHGTHVAGICGALHNEIGLVGAAAPGAELYGLRVFPDARVSKLVQALDWCIENGIDVVNLSLGTAAASETMREAVTRAVEAGVLVVAAAGNSGSRVMFPAAFDGVIAVAALGDTSAFPATSPHRLHTGEHRDGSLFAAAFTCSGPEVDVIAPGVAVVSTVPDGGFAAWDGTSMACPFVTGFVARLLQSEPSLGGLARSRGRAEAVIKRLRSCCRALDLPRDFQGAGLPVWPADVAGNEPRQDGKREVLALLERALAVLYRYLDSSRRP